MPVQGTGLIPTRFAWVLTGVPKLHRDLGTLTMTVEMRVFRGKYTLKFNRKSHRVYRSGSRNGMGSAISYH